MNTGNESSFDRDPESFLPNSQLLANMPDTPASSSVASLQEPKASSSAPASLAMAPAHVANGHSHAVANTKAAESLPNIGEMEAKCGGCQGIIDQEGGGVVVAFG